MERFDEIQDARHRVWDAYDRRLLDWAESEGVERMNPTLGSEHPGHLYWMMMPTDDDQPGLIRHLRERDIVSAFHYQALDESVAGRRLAYAPRPPARCRCGPHTGWCVFRLYAGMSDSDIDRVVEAVTSYRTSFVTWLDLHGAGSRSRRSPLETDRFGVSIARVVVGLDAAWDDSLATALRSQPRVPGGGHPRRALGGPAWLGSAVPRCGLGRDADPGRTPSRTGRSRRTVWPRPATASPTTCGCVADAVGTRATSTGSSPACSAATSTTTRRTRCSAPRPGPGGLRRLGRRTAHDDPGVRSRVLAHGDESVGVAHLVRRPRAGDFVEILLAGLGAARPAVTGGTPALLAEMGRGRRPGWVSHGW